MPDDIAFRSQEYASQVNRDLEPSRQRLQGATEFAVQSFGQGMQMRQRNALAQRELMQRQQEINLRQTMGGSELALQQLRIQQAKEELGWARAIHDTKAVEAQRRIVQSQAETAELNVARLKRENERYGDIPLDKLTLEEKLSIEAGGMKVGRSPSGGYKVIGQLSPEETKAAYARYMEYKKETADIEAGPMIAAAKVRGEYGVQGKEIDAAVRRAVAEIGYQGKIDQAQIEAAVREAVAKLVTAAGQKRVETQAQSAEKIAGKKAESAEKIATGRQQWEADTLNLETLKTQLDEIKFDTNPEAMQEKKRLQGEIKRLQQKLAGSTPPAEAEPQSEEDAQAVLGRQILELLDKPKK